MNPHFTLSRPRVGWRLTFDLPLAEVIYDFYDKLKSLTRGYGSFDYELIDYRESDLVKLDILVNGEKVDALSLMVHRTGPGPGPSRSATGSRRRSPRQMFKIAIQGAIGGNDHRPIDRLRFPERRDRQMLRRGHHPEAKAPGETEERQKKDEDGRLRRNPPERLRGRIENGYRLTY